MATEKEEGCTCSMHGNHPMWNPHRFIILRALLAIIILGVVFHIGMQIGEFKGMIEGGAYGGGYHQMGERHVGDMMYYRQGAPAPASASTAPAGTKSTTTTTTAK